MEGEETHNFPRNIEGRERGGKIKVFGHLGACLVGEAAEKKKGGSDTTLLYQSQLAKLNWGG